MRVSVKTIIAVVCLSAAIAFAYSCTCSRDRGTSDADIEDLPDFESDTTMFFYEGPVSVPAYFGFFPSEGVMDAEYTGIPKVEGLVFMSTGRVHIGVKCPPQKELLLWASKKIKSETDRNNDGEGMIDDAKHFSEIYSGKTSSRTLCKYYIDYFGGERSSVITGEEEEPVEQFGICLMDIWNNGGDLYTFQTDYWYDCMSCGDNTRKSWFTVDAVTGKEYKLEDIVDMSKRSRFSELLVKHVCNCCGTPWCGERMDGSTAEDIIDCMSGIAVVGEGVIAYYYPYILGCGAEGSFHSLIPYDEIQDILNTELKSRIL